MSSCVEKVERDRDASLLAHRNAVSVGIEGVATLTLSIDGLAGIRLTADHDELALALIIEIAFHTVQEVVLLREQDVSLRLSQGVKLHYYIVLCGCLYALIGIVCVIELRFGA